MDSLAGAESNRHSRATLNAKARLFKKLAQGQTKRRLARNANGVGRAALSTITQHRRILDRRLAGSYIMQEPHAGRGCGSPVDPERTNPINTDIVITLALPTGWTNRPLMTGLSLSH